MQPQGQQMQDMGMGMQQGQQVPGMGMQQGQQMQSMDMTPQMPSPGTQPNMQQAQPENQNMPPDNVQAPQELEKSIPLDPRTGQPIENPLIDARITEGLVNYYSGIDTVEWNQEWNREKVNNVCAKLVNINNENDYVDNYEKFFKYLTLLNKAKANGINIDDNDYGVNQKLRDEIYAKSIEGYKSDVENFKKSLTTEELEIYKKVFG